MLNRIQLTILITVVLVSGFLLGKQYEKSLQTETGDTQFESLLKTFTNREDGQPDDVDFSLFWDAWNVLITEYVDSEHLDTQELLYGAIEGLYESTGDPYTVFFPPDDTEAFQKSLEGKFSGIGAEIGIRKDRVTVIAPLPNTPAWRAGLLPKDIIVSIDGDSTEGFELHDAVDRIRGERGTQVILGISREDENGLLDITITRDNIEIPAVRVTELDNNLAHLEVFTFNQNVDKQFDKSVQEIIDKGYAGIILDLRSNPGGLLDSAVNISSYFLKDGDIVVIQRNAKTDDIVFKASRNAKLRDIPIVILVNGGSASASEILAGALRDNNGITIVGEQTFGKGSVQQVIQLSGDTSAKITTSKWLTPNGTSINDEGIVPDVESKRTVEDINAGEDPQLDKALEELQKQL
jgi:carboxyl-terminal processing protease